MAIDIAYIDIDWYCLYWLILAIESCVVLVFWVRHPSARKLLRGKRLTLSLMLSEAGKINQQNKKSHGHGRLWCCDVCHSHSHSHSHTVQPSRCPMNRLDNKWQWFKSIEVDFQAVGFLMLGCSRCADFLFCLIHVIPGGSKKMTGGRFGLASSEEMGWVASQNESWEGGTFIRWLCLYYPEGYMATCGYGSPCSSYDFKWMVVKSEMQPKFQDLKPKISHQWEGPTKACRGGCCLMLLMIKFD